MKADNTDPHFFVHSGRRWRKTDPAIPPELKSELVHEVMAARRAVKDALQSGNDDAVRAARQRVNDAKISLGERGVPWWEKPTDDSIRIRIGCAMKSLLRHRPVSASICPTDAAQVAMAGNWRKVVPIARQVAFDLQSEGWVTIMQKGVSTILPMPGPIRIRRKVKTDEEYATK